MCFCWNTLRQVDLRYNDGKFFLIGGYGYKVAMTATRWMLEIKCLPIFLFSDLMNLIGQIGRIGQTDVCNQQNLRYRPNLPNWRNRLNWRNQPNRLGQLPIRSTGRWNRFPIIFDNSEFEFRRGQRGLIKRVRYFSPT